MKSDRGAGEREVPPLPYLVFLKIGGPMKAKTLIASILTAVFMVSFGALAYAEEAAAPAVEEKPKFIGVGGEVKDFTLSDEAGKSVNFNKDIKGKAKFTGIAFATSSCITCVIEIRKLNELTGKQPDLAAYAMLVDKNGQAAAKTLKDAYDISKVKYLLDPEFTVPPVYGYSYTPAFILIDKSGKVVYMKSGFLPSDQEEFGNKVMSFLN